MDPDLESELLEFGLGYAGEGWKEIGEKLIQRIEPYLLKAGVTILLKGKNKPDLEVLKPALKRLSVVDRAKLFARSGDPRHVPWASSQLKVVLEKLRFFDTERVSKAPKPHFMRNQGEFALQHTFLAAAAYRCGGGAEYAYEYARGVYRLFFYAWRERWILESESNHEWGETAAERIRKVRAHTRGVQRLAYFRKEAEAALIMLLEDFDAIKPQAILAMKEIDCHKSMPGVFRLFSKLKPEDWPLTVPLLQSNYEPIRNVAMGFVTRHGGDKAKQSISEALVILGKSKDVTAVLYALKHAGSIVQKERLPLILRSLKAGNAEVFERALGTALQLSAPDKESALNQAKSRKDFFARRILGSFKLGDK
jgi:hypothetical protein